MQCPKPRAIEDYEKVGATEDLGIMWPNSESSTDVLVRCEATLTTRTSSAARIWSF